MSNLGVAIAIASVEFKNKRDKGGKPYILHCLHVMNKMKYSGDEELMIIAVLHDLIEDTSWKLDDLLAEGFSSRVIAGIKCLTHSKIEPYSDYIFRISNSKDATLVKLQDLRHNADITRMKGITQKDLDRVSKYHEAHYFLSNL